MLSTPEELEHVLDIIEFSIEPLTRSEGVSKGNKLFGAAVLRKSDLSLVVAATNTETKNPLFHGEITTINRFYEIPKSQRPDPKDCIFITTHEPCSLCLNGITWSGFDNFYYLFTYQDSKASFAIPYDIAVLEAVHGADPNTDMYVRHNAFFDAYGLKDLIAATGDKKLIDRIPVLEKKYLELSDIYQQSRPTGDKTIPLA